MSSEEEHALHQVQDSGSDAVSVSSSRYSAHPHALQTFIEKITTFRSATNYVNTVLHPKIQADAAEEKSYRLAGLYDRYFEYADLLATQGLVNEAVRLLDLIPRDYKGSVGAKFDYDTARERLLRASGKSTSTASTSKLSQAAYGTHTASASLSASASVPHAYGYPSYGTINQQTQAATTTRNTVVPSPYDPYNASSATAPVQASNPYASVQSSTSTQLVYSKQHKCTILHIIQVLIHMRLNSHCSCLNPLILSRLHKISHCSTPGVYYPGNPCLHARDMTL